MKPNRVFIAAGDIIEIKVVGSQTAESVHSMVDEVMRLSAKLEKAGKPIIVLDDLRNMGDVTPEGRKAVVHFAKVLEYNKLAMVGKGSILRLGANLMLHATGRAHKARYFEDYDAAVAWLRAA
jgi:UDP-N-acetylmuramyl pentapeptide synthase